MSDNQFVLTRDRTNCSCTKAPQGACRHQFNHSCDSIWLQMTFGLLSQPQKHAALKLGMPNIGCKEASLPWWESTRVLDHKTERSTLPQRAGYGTCVGSCQALWEIVQDFCGLTSVLQNQPHKSPPCSQSQGFPSVGI